jgi:hypothetical protein
MIEYVEDKALTDAVNKMLNDATLAEFSVVRELEITFLCLMCVRTDADGEPVRCKGAPIVCRKVAAPYQVLAGGHYLVVADHNFWADADQKSIQAALFHALMHVNVERTEKGKIKMGTRKPEIQVFTKEVSRFGPHTTELLDFKQALQDSANSFAQRMKQAV